MPHVQKFFEEYSTKGVVVLTVNYSPDEKSFAADFIKAHHYTFPALQAPDADWLDNFKNLLGQESLNYIVDREGRVVFKTSPENKESVETIENEFDMLLAQPSRKQQEDEKEKR